MSQSKSTLTFVITGQGRIIPAPPTIRVWRVSTLRIPVAIYASAASPAPQRGRVRIEQLREKQMSLAANLFTVPPADAPFGRLSVPVETVDRRRRWWIVLSLLLLWFVPRAVMATRLATISPDSVFYLDLADSLASGDRAGVLAEYDFNLFPVTLMWIHEYASSPELADRWFCVILSSLIVLPLFGIVRRLFDTSIATLTCILCGVHPKLIIQSPEILREPLFWLLFLTAIYLLLRAVTEGRWWHFLAAGMATTLALHTRFEGWLLFIPFVWWTSSVAWRERANRSRLLLASTLFLVANPLFLLTLNLTWLGDQPNWELGNFRRLHYVQRWFESLVGVDQSGTKQPVALQTVPAAPAKNDTKGEVAATPQLPAATVAGLVASPLPVAISPWQPDDTPQPLTAVQTAWPFLRAIERGIGPVFLLLMAIAAWHWRRLLFAPGFAALSFVCVTNLIGVWIHLWFGRESSSRYALLVLLLWSPWAALGLRLVGAWLDTRLTNLLGRALPLRSGLVLLLTVAVTHCSYPLSKGDTHRRPVADLGRWIEKHYGARRTIVGPSEMQTLMPYYTRSQYISPWPTLPPHDYVTFLAEQRAEFVILTKHPIDAEWYDSLKRAESGLGYDDITEELPPTVRGRFVLLRSHLAGDRLRQAQAPKHP